MTNGTPITKSLSIGHIVATVGFVFAGFTFVYDLREAIAILEFKGETVEQRIERIVERSDSQFDSIMEHLVRLEEKVDQLKFDGQIDEH